MRSSLDRLNWGPRQAKNKPKWKENKRKKKTPTKRQLKSRTTGAKRYQMAWSVKHERKGNCKSWSAYLWRKVHILYIQWNTNLSKRGDGSLIIKAKLTATTFHQQEKKMNTKFVMHRVKIYLNGSSLFSFYQGMLRTMKMSFYKRKISWDLCQFAYSTESFSRFRTENYVVF